MSNENFGILDSGAKPDNVIRFQRQFAPPVKTTDTSDEFMKTAKAMSELSRQRGKRVKDLVERYDPRDAANFAFVTSQVLSYMPKSTLMAQRLGVAVSTLHRWADGESHPPTSTRIGARLVFSDALAERLGAERIATDHLKTTYKAELEACQSDASSVREINTLPNTTKQRTNSPNQT